MRSHGSLASFKGIQVEHAWVDQVKRIVGYISHVIDRTDTFVHGRFATIVDLVRWLRPRYELHIGALSVANADRRASDANWVPFQSSKVFEIGCLHIDLTTSIALPRIERASAQFWSDGKFR